MASIARWKMPPLAKVYEALGALGDRRVEDPGGPVAHVRSSGGDKRYTVEIGAGGRDIACNDNASFWQGYLGYPAIAVLVGRGLYSPRDEVVHALAGVPWQEINRRNRNDWTKTIAEVERRATEKGCDPTVIRCEVEAVLVALERLAPLRSKRIRPPARPRSSSRTGRLPDR